MLPDGLSAAEYEKIYKEDVRFRPAARAILARHGVGDEPRRLGGSALVYAAGGRVLKLFPPVWASSCAGERAVLEAVAGRLGVASPEVVAAGDLEGWPYLLMTELAGRPLEALWAGWDGATRERAVRGVGELLERLHACPAPAGLEPPGGWVRFLDEQAAVSLERQRGRGLGEADLAWLAGELPGLLAVAQEAARGPHVLLHTEIGPGHVLFDDGGTPRGVLDFADALVGPAAYDLVAAALFVARGDANLVRILGNANDVRAAEKGTDANGARGTENGSDANGVRSAGNGADANGVRSAGNGSDANGVRSAEIGSAANGVRSAEVRSEANGVRGAAAGGVPRALLAFTVLHRYAHLPWYLRETGTPDLPALGRRLAL